jgi:hypothetical protein
MMRRVEYAASIEEIWYVYKILVLGCELDPSLSGYDLLAGSYEHNHEFWTP